MSVKANKQLVENLRGDDDMSQALLEIMEPVLLEREKQVEKRGIIYLVDTMRDYGHNDSEIKKAIMNKYALSEEEVAEYL